MYISRTQYRISFAVIFAAFIVAAALFLRPTEQYPAVVEVVNGEVVSVVAAPTRTAIPISDSNNDGIPDWQEALKNESPVELPEEITALMYSDPLTTTDQFSISFFEQMVRNQNYGDFGRSSEDLISTFATELSNQAVDELITASDISIQADSDNAAIASYTEAVARIIITNEDESARNELEILESSLRNENPDELADLDQKIATYTTLLEATLKLQPTQNLINEHLLLVNAYQALLVDIKAMRNVYNDPMMALLRTKRYQDDATALYNAIVTLYTKAKEFGVIWPENSIVYSLITIN